MTKENHNHEEMSHDQHEGMHMNHSMDHHNHEQMDYDHMDHEHMGHDMSHHHHGDFKKLFLRSLPIGVIIMLITPFMGLTDTGLLDFPYADIVAAVLATILLVYGGKPFYQGAVQEFKDKEPGMMALVSLGVSVSYLYSIYAVIARYISGEHVMDYFFEFSSLILIMLLGHWIEMRALGQAGDAQQSLAELLPKDANLIQDDGSSKKVSVKDLSIGDVIQVQAGENIPADGKIVKGESRVNESLLTGESKPVTKEKGDTVIGGSTNGKNSIQVEITETGDDSFISQVQSLVSDAEGQPSNAENLANKVASWLFYIATIVAVLAFVIWLFVSDLQTAVQYTVSTLVIACPHALGLAIPLAVSRSKSIGANRGLLIKDREAYELTTKADHMILDKTGTLTTGQFKVLQVDTLTQNTSEEDIIALLAGIESGSSHPIAESIVQYADEKDIKAKSFDSSDVVSGEGVVGKLDGKTYKLVSLKAYGSELELDLPAGATTSVLTENDQAIAAVSLGDELKDSSKDLVAVLRDNGIEPLMATGDNENAAKAVADELGIDYRSEQSPEDKNKLVEDLQAKDEIVIMVGDGVNDAPSLARADVGVAIGAGTQVALDSADVILTQSDPGDIESFIELSIKTNRKMNQNLAWGAGYNFIAIPLAAGLLAPVGITIPMALAAVLMSASTVIVAINAVSLRLDD